MMSMSTATPCEGIEELENYGELVGLLQDIPDPRYSRCFVWRETDGSIGGYCFLQTIAVIEPVWVHPKHRGRGVSRKLFNQAVLGLGEGESKGFYCHASSPEVEDYLKRLGMKESGKAFLGMLK